MDLRIVASLKKSCNFNVRKESHCDSPENSNAFDDKGFGDMHDSDEFDNEMAEEEVVKSFISFKVIISENDELVQK